MEDCELVQDLMETALTLLLIVELRHCTGQEL